jgi:hypothetical protein
MKMLQNPEKNRVSSGTDSYVPAELRSSTELHYAT